VEDAVEYRIVQIIWQTYSKI